MSDTIAQVRLTVPQQVRNKKLQKPGFQCPDLLIFAVRGDRCGLFIELKARSPFKKGGVTLLRSDHVEGQAATMERLRREGYECHFAWEFDQCRAIIDRYLQRTRSD